MPLNTLCAVAGAAVMRLAVLTMLREVVPGRSTGGAADIDALSARVCGWGQGAQADHCAYGRTAMRRGLLFQHGAVVLDESARCVRVVQADSFTLANGAYGATSSHAKGAALWPFNSHAFLVCSPCFAAGWRVSRPADGGRPGRSGAALIAWGSLPRHRACWRVNPCV